LNRRLGGVHGRYGRFGGEVFLRLPWMDPNFLSYSSHISVTVPTELRMHRN
jgi:hypothetical protein